MLIVRRWWTRHALQVILAGVVLGGAWFLRQTQNAAVLEIYSVVVRPFQSESPSVREAKLTNARIQELEQQVAELQQQNQQLQELLGYFKNQKQAAITAPIIGRSADAWWKQVTLSRGSQDGIEVGFVVTGVGGLVGRVIEVTPHTSRVLLVSDPTNRVGATITRSRSMGLLQGQGTQIAVMKFFEKVPDVRPGDTVTTSSVSRLYPSGLPIGRVQSVNLETAPAPEAKIELTDALNSVEWVIVHPFKSQFTDEE